MKFGEEFLFQPFQAFIFKNLKIVQVITAIVYL